MWHGNTQSISPGFYSWQWPDHLTTTTAATTVIKNTSDAVVKTPW